MDDNAVFPAGQPVSSPAQGAGNNPPSSVGGIASPMSSNQPQSTGAQSFMPSQPVQPAAPTVPSQQSEPAALQDAGSPRITLADLYGPSGPQDHQSVQTPQDITAQQPQQDTQPVVEPAVPSTGVIPQQIATEAPRVPLPPQETTVPQQAASAQSVQSQTPTPSEAYDAESIGDTGGFHFSKILKFVVIGALVVIALLIMWAIGSLIFSSKNSSSEKVTLTYWGLWEDQSVMGPILADFQKQHPNITVTYTKQDPKDYVRRLLTRTQDGNGPDIFRFHNSWVPPLQNLLLPLPSSVIDKNQLDKNFPPVISQDIVVNGAVYGLPLQMDTLSLFINTDIFAHAGASIPTTWESFITVAKALTVKDPSGRIQTAGAAIGSYENITHASDIVSLLLLQNGANIQKLNGSQNAKDALAFYTSFAKPDGNVWDSTLDNSLTSFSRGKVAMYFGYSYDIFAIKAANPNLHFAIYPVPHLPGRDMTVASYWVEGVSSKSKHPKESIELLQYLSQKDTITKIYTQEAKQRTFGELYAQLDLANGLKSNPLLLPFVSQYKSAQSSFFVGDTYYDEYNGALDRYLGNAVNSVLKNTSPESALTTLSQGVDQVTSQFTAQKAR